jgi:hypothetical protein
MNRSRHIFTCGHTGESIREADVIKIKSVNAEGKNCIENMVLCSSCAIWYRKNNLIIDFPEQAERWLAQNKSIEQIDI